ncbi:MAG: hypothetical protein L3K19_02205 [Thermoplasmata archaeon]|nr:hypothetical protein [Thermoplasmata archaeon]
MHEAERDERIPDRATGSVDEAGGAIAHDLALGHDIRFLLVCVGGGAIRIGARIARRHTRYLETVAINCDTRVQGAEEFDRQVCLGPETGVEGDTGGSALVGGILARAAEPALHRLFEGAPFVTILASLGGGAGTGALPVVLRAAARSSEVVSLFVIKPFACEPERRAMAERAIARLHFVDAFVDKQHQGLATLEVLDNQAVARSQPTLAFTQLDRHWADLVASHVEDTFLVPAEAALEATRRSRVGTFAPIHFERPIPVQEPERLEPTVPGPIPNLAPLTAFAPAFFGYGDDAELTFEVESVPRLSPLP